MKTNSYISTRKIARKVVTVMSLGCIALGSFATLGDGKLNKDKPKKNLFAQKSQQSTTFSMRSGYDFRGNAVINQDTRRYINLNTVVTYPKGGNSYVLPMKKTMVMGKLSFNPNQTTRTTTP